MSPAWSPKEMLVESILLDLRARFDIPYLKFVGYTRRGGAQIVAATGEVRFEKPFLECLSARAIQMVTAHEAGHALSYRARHTQNDALPWLGLALTLTALVCLAAAALGYPLEALLFLAGALLAEGAIAVFGALVGGVRQTWFSTQRRAAFEEEIRADAFAAIYCGGLSAWKAALSDVRQLANESRSRALDIRESALEELARKGLLETVARDPAKKLPRLAALRGL